jgi:hypothetical protein
MKATISVSRNDFWFDWTLVVDFQDGLVKHFYLGQDSKFCYRVLRLTPSDLIERMGTNDFSKESVRKKIAKFIIKELDLDAKKLRTLERWSLACK